MQVPDSFLPRLVPNHIKMEVLLVYYPCSTALFHVTFLALYSDLGFSRERGGGRFGSSVDFNYPGFD